MPLTAGFRRQGEGAARKMGVGLIGQFKKSFSGRDEKKKNRKTKKRTRQRSQKDHQGEVARLHKKSIAKREIPMSKKIIHPMLKLRQKRASKKMRHRKSDT